jgi:hypothetical protein
MGRETGARSGTSERRVFGPDAIRGKFSLATFTNSAAFKRWFGNSAVVDADGKPLVVYHGTKANFSSFNLEKFGQTDGGWAGEGFYFAPNPDEASLYATSISSPYGNSTGANVMPVFLSAKNPLEWRIGQDGNRRIQNKRNELGAKAFAEWVQSQGYDSIHITSPDIGKVKGEDQWVVFKPEQIKSATGNIGTYDGSNPDIRFSRRSPTPTQPLDDETRFQAGARVMQDYFQRVQQMQNAIVKAGGNLRDANNTYQAETLSHGRKAELVREFKDAQFQPLMDKLAKDGLTPDELALFGYAKHAPSRNRVMADRQHPAQAQVDAVQARAQAVYDQLETAYQNAVANGSSVAALQNALAQAEEDLKKAKAAPRFYGTEEQRQALSGMSNKEAQDILDAFRAEGKYAKLEEAHKELMRWAQQIRDMMLDYGLITREKYDALNSMWDFYVPLKTEMLEGEIDSSPISFGGRGFDIRGQVTMRALGRQSRAGDIIENIVAEFERIVDLGEDNTVAQVFLQFVQDNPNKDLYEIDVVNTKQAFNNVTGKVSQTFGIEKGKGTVGVKVKGKDVYITVKDVLLAQAIRADNLLKPGKYSMALVAPVTNLMRNTLTRYNPAFAFVNAARDVTFGATAMKHELGNMGVVKYTKHYPNAHKVASMFMLNRWAYDKLSPSDRRMFDEFRAAGGMTGGFYKKDVAEIRSDIRDIMLHNGAAPKDWVERVKSTKVGITLKGKRYATGPYDLAQKTLRLLEYIGSVSEAGVRFAGYKAAREMGKTPAQAARIAKDMTTNFDRKGEVGRVFNIYYVFYNAAAQGAEMIYRMAKNPKMRVFFAGVTSSFVGLALFNAMNGGDDEEDGQPYWDKIPQHIKERNFIFMLPPGFDMEGTEKIGSNGRYFKFPIQYGFNIFTNLGYQIADAGRYMVDPTRGTHPAKAGINAVLTMVESVNPFGGSPDNGHALFMAILPTIFDIPYQFSQGVDGFGRPIVPMAYGDEESILKSETTTARQQGGVFHKIARGVNAAAGGDQAVKSKLDFYPGSYELVWKNLTGGTGTFFTDTINLTQAMLGDPADRPETTIRDVPIAKSFYGTVGDAEDVGLFYDRQRAVAAMDAEDKRQRELNKYTKDPKKLALLALSAEAKNSLQMIRDINGDIRKTRADASMTDAAKVKRIKELQADRADWAVKFNKSYNEVMQQWADGKFD